MTCTHAPVESLITTRRLSKLQGPSIRDELERASTTTDADDLEIAKRDAPSLLPAASLEPATMLAALELLGSLGISGTEAAAKEASIASTTSERVTEVMKSILALEHVQVAVGGDTSRVLPALGRLWPSSRVISP